MRREGGREGGVMMKMWLGSTNHPMCTHTYTHAPSRHSPMSPVSPSAAGSDQLAEVNEGTLWTYIFTIA